MAKVQEYVRQQTSGQVAALPEGVSAAEIQARGLQEFGSQLSQAGGALNELEAANETSKAIQQLAKKQSELTQKWQQRFKEADPEDTQLAETFLQEFDDEMDELSSSFTTPSARNTAATGVAKMRAHFDGVISEGQAELAAQQAQRQVIDTFDELSATLISDPSLLEQNYEMAEAAINSIGYPISKQAREDMLRKGRLQLTKASIQGWTKDAPGFVIKQLEAKKWDKDLDSDTKFTLFRQAEARLAAQDAEKSRQAAEARRIKREQQNLVNQDLMEKYIKGQLTMREVLDNDILDAFGTGSQQQWIQMIKRDSTKPIRTDSRIYMKVLNDIYNGTITDEKNLIQYAARGEISVTGANSITTLRNELQGKGTEEFEVKKVKMRDLLKSAHARLVKTPQIGGIQDRKGTDRLAVFSSFAQASIATARKSGKSLEEINNTLLSPTHKDWLGHSIKAFEAEFGERIESQMETLPSGALPKPAKEGGDDIIKNLDVKTGDAESESFGFAVDSLIDAMVDMSKADGAVGKTREEVIELLRKNGEIPPKGE
jgi:cell pole-organizing protein PopZ